MPRKTRLSGEAERVRKNLVRYRNNWNMTQSEAAEAARVPFHNWIRYESGANGIPLETLRRVADFFGVTLDSFFEEEPPLPPAENRPVILFRAVKGAEEDPLVREFVEKKMREIRDFETQLRELRAGRRGGKISRRRS